jgi:capsular exopolysaccharide synthesis family protein
VALDVRIRDIERQLGGMAVGYEQALHEQVATLDRTLTNAAGRLAIIPSQQMQNARLQRKVTLLDDLYRVLEGRLQEAEVAEAVELPSVRLVDAASVPFAPVSPRLPLNLALGFVLAVTSGLGVALLAEARDTRVRERQEVERQTGLPVLTIVPHLRRPGSVMPLPALSRKSGASPAVKQLATVRTRTYRASADKQVALECFRSLAADIGFAARAAGNGGFQTVAVTSPGRGEGKTLTACNLALVRAADGVRTLLIDGDMRAGRVARFFEFPPAGPGLSDVLTGGTDVGGVWRGVVGQSELWVVPAGTPTEHATSLLGSSAFARIIDRARTRFELVIVDTPPLNMISDAATVAASVDAVVVVVREGWTEREALEVTLARLERAGGNVVGVVLNDVTVSKEYAVNYGYSTAGEPG